MIQIIQGAIHFSRSARQVWTAFFPSENFKCDKYAEKKRKGAKTFSRHCMCVYVYVYVYIYTYIYIYIYYFFFIKKMTDGFARYDPYSSAGIDPFEAALKL